MGIDSQGRGVALVVTRKGAFAALSVAGFALLLVLYVSRAPARTPPLILRVLTRLRRLRG
jgi:hypothetical protein